MPITINFTRARGDTFPIRFTVKDSLRDPVDITGYSLTLTVDPAENPTTSDNNLFQISGVLVTPASGIFEFRPSTANMDLTPGTYYFDVQATDPSGYIRTLVKGKLTITQDVTK